METVKLSKINYPNETHPVPETKKKNHIGTITTEIMPNDLIEK